MKLIQSAVSGCINFLASCQRTKNLQLFSSWPPTSSWSCGRNSPFVPFDSLDFRDLFFGECHGYALHHRGDWFRAVVMLSKLFTCNSFELPLTLESFQCQNRPRGGNCKVIKLNETWYRLSEKAATFRSRINSIIPAKARLAKRFAPNSEKPTGGKSILNFSLPTSPSPLTSVILFLKLHFLLRTNCSYLTCRPEYK